MQFSITQLETIARSGVPIVIYRRNYITGGLRPDHDDTFTVQIVRRQNLSTRKHIARQLLYAKFKSMRYFAPTYPNLSLTLSIDELRRLEAHHANAYWRNYYRSLGSDQTRRGDNPVSMALDASSKFLIGIILRWITYHHLSPYHGYLHEPTTYPALAYDLIEPYRGAFEFAIWHALNGSGAGLQPDASRTTAIAVHAVKEALEEKVYCGLTRQIVTRHELLHGIVLSLKFYLHDRQSRFMVPRETKPNGGRPRKVPFKMYGRSAGKTDFWQQARLVSGASD